MYTMRRKLFFIATSGAMILGLANVAAAQYKSPHESTSVELGGHKVTITYGRPSLHGRKMIGEHEPYGKVWRTGADEATTIETDAALDINGLKVPAGTYALFTIPDPKSWTLIINKTAKQWGAFSYKESTDLGRTKMNVAALSAPVEEFTITMTPNGADAFTLKLSWQDVEASVPVKVSP
jgi:hypothetical protein